MNAYQLYETTIYDRDADQAFGFLTVPGHSIVFPAVPPIGPLALEFGILPLDPDGPGSVLSPVEGWSLPTVIDALMNAQPRRLGLSGLTAFALPLRADRAPSPFAQHLTYASVVPVESSPLESASLAGLVASHEAQAVLGWLADHPVMLLKTGGMIILGYAVRGVGQAVQVAARRRALHLMGVPDTLIEGHREAANTEAETD